MINTINLLNALGKSGEPFDIGCSEADIPKLLEIHNTLFEHKKHCIIKDWKWCDVSLPEKDVATFKAQGMHPSFVLANYVIFDESGRFNEGDWVRTTLLTQFHEPAIFETINTVYILVGPGTRESKSLKDAAGLFG